MLTKFNKLGDDTKLSRLGLDTKLNKLGEDIKLNKLGDETKLKRFGVDTKLNKLGLETKLNKLGVETNPRSDDCTLLNVKKPGPTIELTSRTCVLIKYPTLIVLVLIKNVLTEVARISGKSIKPSPVSKVIVLTVKLDMVALEANKVLIVTLLELKEREMDVENVEKKLEIEEK